MTSLCTCCPSTTGTLPPRACSIENQSAYYRDSVLPPDVTARVSVVAASPMGWERDVGQRGTIIGLRSFGISAPGWLHRLGK